MAQIKSLADKKLETAFREYGKLLEKYCRVRLGEASQSTEDCVQEAFCIYYRKILAGEAIDQPKAFLYRTADNMVKRAKAEYYKRASRFTTLDEVADIEADPLDELDFIDCEKLTQMLLNKLTDSERLLYKRKYVERKSLKEIGLELSIPPTTVANRTSRLRSKIKMLSEELISEAEKGGSCI